MEERNVVVTIEKVKGAEGINIGNIDAAASEAAIVASLGTMLSGGSGASPRLTDNKSIYTKIYSQLMRIRFFHDFLHDWF